MPRKDASKKQIEWEKKQEEIAKKQQAENKKQPSSVAEGKRKALSSEDKESKLKSILGKGLFKRK